MEKGGKRSRKEREKNFEKVEEGTIAFGTVRDGKRQDRRGSEPTGTIDRRGRFMYTEKEVETLPMQGTLFFEEPMKDWKEKILQSDAGRANPELAEELIEKNGAEVLDPSPLVGSPSQVSRSPAAAVREEVLALAPVIKELVRRDNE